METDNNAQKESSYDLGIESMDVSQFELPQFEALGFDIDFTDLDLNL